MSVNTPKNLPTKQFNAPFKVPTPKSNIDRGPTWKKSRSPAVAAEAGASSSRTQSAAANRTRKEPDILSDLSQEQGKLLPQKKARVIPEPSPDLHLTSSQKEEIHNTVDKQIKKAYRRRLELNFSSRRKPNASDVPEISMRTENQRDIEGGVNNSTNLQTTSTKSPSCSSKERSYTFKAIARTSKSPCYQPKLAMCPPKSPHHQQKPKTLNPHPQKSPRTPKTNYSSLLGQEYGDNPKSPGVLSGTSSIFPHSPYQPAGDMSPAIPTQGRLYRMTSGQAVEDPPTPGGETLLPPGGKKGKRARSQDLDTQSQFEFPLSPQSQRALRKNKKMKSKLKKKAIEQVLAIIDRCRREMEIIQARRKDLYENPYYSEPGLEDNFPLYKTAQAQTIHVVASSASGGIVNHGFDVAQTGSLQNERRGFNENYRQGNMPSHQDYQP